MNKVELFVDLSRCGYTLNKHTNKWTNDNISYPCVKAQYFDYDSQYQYSNIRKLK